MIKVGVSTLGCKVNQCETAGLIEAFDREMFSIVPFNSTADLYIINTCTVTHKTDFQSRQLIRRAFKANPQAHIFVTGCYAQRAPEEIARIPGVTAIIGQTEKDIIPSIVAKTPKGTPHIVVNNVEQSTSFTNLFATKFTEKTRAFLKIQDGCDSFCSYCIVPYTRGRSRSLSVNETIRQIKALAASGYREIVFTGIHLGKYGYDLTPSATLVEIIDIVKKDKLVDRIRLSSIEITEITDDILGFMSDSDVLCRHLHIPLQSGDNRILAAMKRDYDTSFFMKRIHEILKAVPDIAIGIDVMVGFPGEGEEEFNNTLRLIDEIPVAYLHVFPYSERPATAAAMLSNKIKESDKKKRGEILRNLGREKRKAYADRFVGKKLSVLTEGKKKGLLSGMIKGISDNYIPVILKDGNPFMINRIIQVVPNYARDGILYGAKSSHE